MLQSLLYIANHIELFVGSILFVDQTFWCVNYSLKM